MTEVLVVGRTLRARIPTVGDTGRVSLMVSWWSRRASLSRKNAQRNGGAGEMLPRRRCHFAATACVSRSSHAPGSRGRRRQDLLVLGAILGGADLGGDDEEVVVHLGLGEGLAELGHELPFLQVPQEDLELLHVLCG